MFVCIFSFLFIYFKEQTFKLLLRQKLQVVLHRIKGLDLKKNDIDERVQTRQTKISAAWTRMGLKQLKIGQSAPFPMEWHDV